MNKWKNYGDKNFTKHGGCLVRPHWTEEELNGSEHPELLKDEYDVFYLVTPYDDAYFAMLYHVDLHDYMNEDNQDTLKLVTGLSEEELKDSMLMASELVTTGMADTFVTYKTAYPSCIADKIVTPNQLADYMRKLGASEYLGELQDLGFSDSDLNICDEFIIDSDEDGNYIEATYELWCDVDKKFGTDTRDDEDTWINFYTRFYPDSGEFKATYIVDSDDNSESFDYILNDSEISLIRSLMNKKAKKEDGVDIYTLYKNHIKEK